MPLSAKALELINEQITVILGTCSAQGQPNIAPMALYWVISPNRIVFADIWLKTVVDHIRANPHVQVCIWDEATKETHKSNGNARYATEGADVDYVRNELMAAGEGEHNALKGVVVVDLT